MSMFRETAWGYNANLNEAFSYIRYADGMINLPLSAMREKRKYISIGFVSRDQAEATGKSFA